MDFNLSEERVELMAMIKDFVNNEIRPIAAACDEEERFPDETIPKMAEMGLLGIPYPEEYGGAGLDNVAYAMAVEEISKVCASTGIITSVHTSLGSWPIFKYGTEEQKQKYLVNLASGKWLGSFGLTEPNAGTDASGQQTIIEDKGDHWLVNGSKQFITNMTKSQSYVVFGMTDKSQGTKGISAVILEKGMPGFTFGKREKTMGIRASIAGELIFDNVQVPKENLLGKLGEGFKIAMTTLDGGRIGVAAQAVGIAQGAMDECLKYIKERKQFGKRISQFQNTQFQLADVQTKIDAARLLVWRAANAKDTGKPYSHLAAMAKLFASETANEAARKCLQYYGGYGFTREYPAEKFMRDAKITEIYEGTSEVQRMVISGWMKVN